MRRYLPLAIIATILAVAATAFNATLIVSVLSDLAAATPETFAPTLGVAIAVILCIFSSAAFLIAAILDLVGLILVKRAGGGRMVAFYAIEMVACILIPVISYVILFTSL